MAFRGASAEAVADLTDDLSARVSGGGDAARIGGDLFSVAAVLRAEPGLRRVVTDASVAPDARSGLAHQVLSGKIDDGALALVSSAVRRRWTATRDLADALEHLGVVAVVKSAGDAGRLADELFAVGQLVKDSPELRDALSDRSRSAEDKRALVRTLLDGKTLPATTMLVEQSLAGSYRTVGVALAAYQQVAAEVHGQGIATVRVARPLADADRQRLTDALSRQRGREVHLNVVVEPGLIGGIRVEIGDDVIDGTVSSRLDEAARALAG